MIGALPWNVVQDDVKHMYVGTHVFTRPFLVAQIKTEIDPAVQKSGALANLAALELLQDRKAKHFFIPMEATLGKVFKEYISEHKWLSPTFGRRARSA